MSPDVREALAQAYERGDAEAAGKLLGGRLLDVPISPAGTVGKVGKAGQIVKPGPVGKVAQTVVPGVGGNVGQVPNGSTAGAGSTAAADSRGLSNLGGIFSSTSNEAGGRVWTSTGTISENDFTTIVNSELMQGKNVNIISGVHGSPDGSLILDLSMYIDDVKAFSRIPGVKVYNYSDLTPQQINTLLKGLDTTIGGFCNSGACLKK